MAFALCPWTLAPSPCWKIPSCVNCYYTMKPLVLCFFIFLVGGRLWPPRTAGAMPIPTALSTLRDAFKQPTVMIFPKRHAPLSKKPKPWYFYYKHCALNARKMFTRIIQKKKTYDFWARRFRTKRMHGSKIKTSIAISRPVSNRVNGKQSLKAPIVVLKSASFWSN